MNSISNKKRCDVCEKEFASSFALKRHRRTVHEKLEFSKCDECEKEFSSSFALERHRSSVHKKLILFECAECQQKFNRKDILIKHISRSHCEKEQITFECAECSRKYKCKRRLIWHANRLHRKAELECAICAKKMYGRRSLVRHIKRLHGFELNDCSSISGQEYKQYNEESRFICSYCEKKLPSQQILARHIRTFHYEEAMKFKCGYCSRNFPARRFIEQHYETVHRITLETSNLQFENVEKFVTWKSNIQRQTVTRFRIRNTWKTCTNTTVLHVCHRSSSRVKQKKPEDLCCFQKKLSSFCPAKMLLVIKNSDGTCSVKYMKTHVGHAVNGCSELCQLQIVAGFKKEAPRKELKNRLLLSNMSNEKENRLNANNTGTYHLDKDCQLLYNDDEFLDIFVTEHNDSILFYKKQSEEDAVLNRLNKDDFVFIFMDKMQQENLQRYGHNVIAFNNTRGISQRGFQLHILLVLDVNCVVPAALLITNRNDEVVIDIFLQCVFDRVGVLKPKTIISDAYSRYYNSWLKVMKVLPEFKLFCTWHVYDAWRRNLKMISNAEKRRIVRRTLLSLCRELNPAVFQLKLQEFLSTRDDDLQTFISYFQRNYSNNAECWTYCYGKYALVNADMAIEAWLRRFKYCISKETKTNSLIQCLIYIKRCLQLRLIDEINSPVRFEERSRLELRYRHQQAVNFSKENEVIVEEVKEYSWLVQTFNLDNDSGSISEMCMVEKQCGFVECRQNADGVCEFPCDLCETFFHAYTCNCTDAMNFTNTCKHIHIVGMFLKNRNISFPTENGNSNGHTNQHNEVITTYHDGSDELDAFSKYKK